MATALPIFLLWGEDKDMKIINERDLTAFQNLSDLKQLGSI